METFKKISILGLSLLAAGFLYSAGNETKYSQTQLPEDKIEGFELKTVADGRRCHCELLSPNPQGQIKVPYWDFKDASECNAQCANKCFANAKKQNGDSNYKGWSCE